MKERLTKLIKEAQERYIYAEEQAQYLMDNGVIVPPCKIGCCLYFIQKNRIVFGIVAEITANKSDLFAYVFEFDNGDIVDEWSIPLGNLGKTVFLTREEAERALKGGVQE